MRSAHAHTECTHRPIPCSNFIFMCLTCLRSVANHCRFFLARFPVWPALRTDPLWLRATAPPPSLPDIVKRIVPQVGVALFAAIASIHISPVKTSARLGARRARKGHTASKDLQERWGFLKAMAARRSKRWMQSWRPLKPAQGPRAPPRHKTSKVRSPERRPFENTTPTCCGRGAPARVGAMVKRGGRGGRGAGAPGRPTAPRPCGAWRARECVRAEGRLAAFATGEQN